MRRRENAVRGDSDPIVVSERHRWFQSCMSSGILVILLSYWTRSRLAYFGPGLRYKFMQAIWFLYAKDMQAGFIMNFICMDMFLFCFLCRITQKQCGNCSWFFMKKIYSRYKFSIMRGIVQFPVWFLPIGWKNLTPCALICSITSCTIGIPYISPINALLSCCLIDPVLVVIASL
jgi:hypothetical protein